MISRYEANHPVGDFYCEGCESDFELKSKDGLKFPSKIADGAYETMIERITSLHNPNFFFLSYKDFAAYAKTKALKTANIEVRGWLLDTLNCVEKLQKNDFTLEQMYMFEPALKAKHPENNFVKDKIRQQLQYLRDKGFIEFLGSGRYRKI